MKNNHNLKTIAKTVSELEESQVQEFFKAFFTPKEIETLESRVNLVDMLLQEKSQREIVDLLGVSFSQINRGSHELQYGAGKKFFPRFFKK